MQACMFNIDLFVKYGIYPQKANLCRIVGIYINSKVLYNRCIYIEEGGVNLWFGRRPAEKKRSA